MNLKYIQQEAVLVDSTKEPVKRINEVARVCYRSSVPDEIVQQNFVKNLISKGHESPLEFVDFTWFLTTNRGIANELVRHRLASYMQESTRYINYENMEVIEPEEKRGSYSAEDIEHAYGNAVMAYHELLKKGVTKQFARDVLPLGLATRMYCKMNLREFRHFLSLRLGISAHPSMRTLAQKMMQTIYDTYELHEASTLFYSM